MLVPRYLGTIFMASLGFAFYGILKLMEKVVKVDESKLAQAKKPQHVQDHILNEEFPNNLTEMAPKKENSKLKILAIFIGVVLLGVGTGFGASKVVANPNAGTSAGSNPKVSGAAPVTQSDNEAGIKDDSAFPDTAEGTLVEGGIDGEGTHHLDRGLGKDKYVYLTSTVINLESFVGKKVEVHGQTMSGKKAGWLMDVGRVKVLE